MTKVLNKDEARQAEEKGRVWKILTASLALTLGGLLLITVLI